jgi:uncharacterized protein (DUF1800 family)
MATTPRIRARRGLIAGTGLVVLLGTAPIGAGPRSAVPKTPDAATIVHVLDRIGFGPRPGDVARVQQMGLAAYIDAQLHPDRIDDSALDARLATFETLTMSSRDLAQEYFLPAQQMRREAKSTSGAGPAAAAPGGTAKAALSPEARRVVAAQQAVMADLTQARMLRAVMSERQLQEVLTDFWLNHFNVFVGKGPVRQYLTEYERDAIRPHVLGRFRDLLGAVAHSPAMLFYLDNWQSSTPEPAVPAPNGRRPGAARLTPAARARLMDRMAQQAARPQQARPTRGINENYARELMELHTLGVDGGYTQEDVIALARILTGWTIDRPRDGGAFVFRPAMHDQGTKTLLGVTFAPDGEREGERALDMLAQHPATARHIAFELAQRLVADEPPAALVDRAARTFLDTKGDIRAVVETIVTSPEFFAPAARGAKVKTPLEFVVSAVRASGATVTGAQPLVAAMRTLGMPLYGCQPPTGYSMTADAWVNTGALLNRMNFAVQLVGGHIQPVRPNGRGGDAPDRPIAAGRGRRAATADARGPIQLDVHAIAPDTSAASQEAVIVQVLAGHASDATRQTLARADTPQDLLALALGSPEFQHR